MGPPKGSRPREFMCEGKECSEGQGFGRASLPSSRLVVPPWDPSFLLFRVKPSFPSSSLPPDSFAYLVLRFLLLLYPLFAVCLSFSSREAPFSHPLPSSLFSVGGPGGFPTSSATSSRKKARAEERVGEGGAGKAAGQASGPARAPSPLSKSGCHPFMGPALSESCSSAAEPVGTV